ncbi:hypothetical protein [Enterocloster lavalensis]|uniref:hypothetical protein n=1 Tax=Enterocloster lavalensis TaxID=460384 RepID=UPI002664E817|nr:hypothetical protein [Enterocloster lavalensis]
MIVLGDAGINFRVDGVTGVVGTRVLLRLFFLDFDREERGLMAYEYSQIIELFEMLTLREKEILIKKLQEMIVQERNVPEKSPLEEAWTDIQRNIKKLSHYS